MGNRYLAELNYEQAVLTFQGVIEVENRNVDAWYGYAQASVGLAKDAGEEQTGTYYETAETAYLRVMELEPERTESYVELAQVYENTGRTEQAIALLESAPDNVTHPDRIAEQLEELRLMHYAELRIRVLEGEEPVMGAQVNVEVNAQEPEMIAAEQSAWLPAMETQLPAGIMDFATANEEHGYFNGRLYDLNGDGVPEVMVDTVGETDCFYLDNTMTMQQLILGDGFCLLSDGTLIDQSMRFDVGTEFRFTKYLYDAQQRVYREVAELQVIPNEERLNQVEDWSDFDVYQVCSYSLDGRNYYDFAEVIQEFSPEFAERIAQANVDGNLDRAVKSIMSFDNCLIDTIENLNDFPARLRQYAEAQAAPTGQTENTEDETREDIYLAETDSDGWCVHWIPEGVYLVTVTWNGREIYRQNVALTTGERVVLDEIQTDISTSQTEATYGETVSAGGSLYYWHYNRDAFHEAELFGYYTHDPAVSSQLVRNTDGVETVLAEGAGSGILCVFEDNIYCQTETDGSFPVISAVNQVDGTTTTLTPGILLGVTSDGGYLLFATDCLASYDIGENRSIALTDEGEWPTFIALHKDWVYYATTDIDSGELTISRIAPDGSGKTKLITVDSIYESSYVGEVRFPVVDGKEYLYFSYGNISGTGSFYQGGKIARVRLDGSDAEVIAGGEIVDGEEQLLAADFSVNEDGTVHSYEDYERISDDLYSGLTKHFSRDGTVYFIDEENGAAVELFDRGDYAAFSSLSADTGDDDQLLKVVSAELQGDEAFLRLEQSFYAPEGDIGWRTAYRLQSGILLKKELKTGKVETVYQY